MPRWFLLPACLVVACDKKTPDSDDIDDIDDSDPLCPEEVEVGISDNPTMVLEKRLAITLPSCAAAATLRCVSPDDPLEDHRLPVAASGELRLYGILPDLTYTCTLEEGTEVLWQGTFDVAPLPDGFPSVVVSGYDPSSATLDDGYTLFNHWKRGAAEQRDHRIVLIDSAGRVRWYLPLDEATSGGISARWLGNGQLVVGGGDRIEPGLYNLSGEVLFEVAPAVAIKGYHHEALVTPEGWIVSLQATDDLGPGGATIDGFRIEATDPVTAEVVWRFDSQTAIDAGTLPLPPGYDGDPFHANAVSWLNDDPEGPSAWVTLRGTNAIARIDRATGAITKLIGPDFGYALLDESANPLPYADWFWGLHAPEIEQGNVFTVFDNGGSRPGGSLYSRAMSFRVDSESQATLLWEWTEDGWYEPDFGSVRKTAADSVVIGSGHCSDCPPAGDVAWILEVDMATGVVLWRYDFTTPDDTIYRAEAVDRCAFPNRRYCAE